ncbi:MAG: hypothetical protein R3E76_14835 [Planctomycetota bacterium]
MIRTGFLLVAVTLMAASLLGQPGSNFAFDVVVNNTYTITPSYGSGPNGDMPDAELGLAYDDARVFVKRPPDFGTRVFQYVEVNTTNPWPAGITLAFPRADEYFAGVPSGAAGTYYIWLRAVWLNTANSMTEYSTLQGYQIEVRPMGYGVVYPPAPGGGSGSSSGGGDDSNCSTAVRTNLKFSAALITILGALVWRRKRAARG